MRWRHRHNVPTTRTLKAAACARPELPERKPTPREEWRAEQERRTAALAGHEGLIHFAPQQAPHNNHLNHLDIGKIVRAATAAESAARHGDDSRANAALREAESLLAAMRR